MTIIDSFENIYRAFPSGDFSLKQWRAYADDIHSELGALCEDDTKDYDFEKEVLPHIQLLLKNRNQAELIHQSFLVVTDSLKEIIHEKLNADLDVTIVLYLGLCNGAGWATQLGNHPAVLLGMEKILELGWSNISDMRGLLYHELGHIWHFSLRGEVECPLTPKDRAIWQLYTEGMAMYAEQRLCSDTGFYHQDKNGWLDWCKSNKALLFQEYHRRINTGESVQDFFGDWNQFLGHSDCGYFIGAELINHLSKTFDNHALSKLDLNDVYTALSNVASQYAQHHTQRPRL